MQDRDRKPPKPIPEPNPIHLGIIHRGFPWRDTLFLAGKPLTGLPSAPATPFKSTGSYTRRQTRLGTHNVGSHGVDPARRASLRI